MNCSTFIAATLAADSVVTALLSFLPGDTRTVRVYTTWLTREDTPAAFMKPSIDTLWPSVFISPGGQPKRHPQDYKIPGLTVLYPQVWCYCPMLAGIDFEQITRRVLHRAMQLLEEAPLVDPDTGIPGRIGWFGDQDGRRAEEYVDTWGASSMYQYRARWREEGSA